MSAIQKITGPLTQGPSRQDRADTVYKHIRVGGTFLKAVKVPAVLDSLLRNGAACTMWVATINTPTPFLFKTQIHVVYAVEVSGVVYRAIEEVKRGWTTGKWLAVLVLLGIGVVTIFIYIGVLFWICAFRLSFVQLPLEEMRREPA